MDTVDFSDMVGVFRNRTHADQAIDELKQAGFQEDQIHLTEYDPHAAEDADAPPRLGSDKRFTVLVRAEGREQEAVGIMAQNSANNTDLPPGTKLVHGSIVGTDAVPVDLMPGSSEVASDSSSEEALTPDNAGESIFTDDPNLLRDQRPGR